MIVFIQVLRPISWSSLSFRTNAIVLMLHSGLHYSFSGAKTSRRRNVQIDLGHILVETDFYVCRFLLVDF